MKKTIRIRYFLIFLYFCIVLLNWTKLDAAWKIDDQNLLIFFTSPSLWIINDINTAFEYIELHYILSLIIWFAFGYLLDLVIKKLFTNR